MSAGDLDRAAAFRVGQIGCVCPGVARHAPLTDNRVALAAGFGLAVLAQALTLSVVPEQSRLLAPSAAQIGWPFALLLIGAAAASFPAALLLDAFGRRAALALGASLGAAGGALSAFSIAHGLFYGLCLGGFWLGLAQGFALFYRHIAAQGATRAGLIVLGGGAGAALAAPLVVHVAATPAATLVAAAALHIVALGLAVRLPHGLAAPAATTAVAPVSTRYCVATAAGALAWFGMSAGMLHGPLSLAVCSATPAFVGGAMGWHLFSMYGPAAFAARWPTLAAPPGGAVGMIALALGAGAVLYGGSVGVVTTGMIAIGVGWSLVNVATLRALHDHAPPSRRALALHDLCLLTAAAAGALLLS